MANPERRDELVEVRVLCERYGATGRGVGRDPIATKGQVIKVARAEYEAQKGHFSMLQNKLVGGSLFLVADEKKVVEKKEQDQKKKEEAHFARREQFRAQSEEAQKTLALRAEQEAQAARSRADELKKAAK